jgi:hypothetical protein
MRHVADDDGSALLPVMLIMFLFVAIALGATAVTHVETLVVDNYRHAGMAVSAAEAGVEIVVSELRALGEWTPAINGTRQSPLSQGAFAGAKPIPGGGTVDLCCGPASASDRLSNDTALSPVPARRTLQWRPYLWTTIDALAPRDPPSRLFVAVWVANDEDDAGGAIADSNDLVVIRAEALDAQGLRRPIEVLLGRQPLSGGLYSGGALTEEERRMRIGILRWREVR